ncbi:PIN domain-containing protein [Acidimangrovimonas pyrenivorans]|uniref:PIN domain-containing protein n=1 Tax=Acidimangrovimonas pyrenivorans TaxID=2030798 RepID=A0ABV7AC34_9RHOB
MPTLNEEEIKARIADGSLTAVTLDTSIFDRYGCNLDFPLLGSLTQFKAGNVSVVFSDVIIAEVTSHISEKAIETQGALKQAIKKFSKAWKTAPVDAEIAQALQNDRDPSEFSATCVKAYVDNVEGEIVLSTANTAITEAVMQRYFAGGTPFENKKEKKSEFPDAFALVSLDQTFSQRRQYLLCVSADKGWHAFAEQSDWLLCVKDLDVALSYFHDTGRNIADNVVEMLKNGVAEELINDIELSIQARLDDFDFEPETHSGLDYEAEPTSASLQTVGFDSLSNPIITDANDEEVSFTVSVEADVLFEAGFTFYAYDSIDKDYVTLSTEYAEIESKHTFKLVVTVSRDLDPEPEPISVAVVKDRLEVNFGYVEPFPNEDPTHEKY